MNLEMLSREAPRAEGDGYKAYLATQAQERYTARMAAMEERAAEQEDEEVELEGNAEKGEKEVEFILAIRSK